MLLSVSEFCDRAYYGIDGLVDALEEQVHSKAPDELDAWRKSLHVLAMALHSRSLRRLHIQFGTHPGLILEYQFPSVRNRADAILLGRGPAGPAGVIVELKDWMTDGDAPGPREDLVFRRALGMTKPHPSDQVRGYVEWCRTYHSTVQDSRASMAGCALITFSSDVAVYRAKPHDLLVAEFPIFARNRADLETGLPAFIETRLVEADPAFATAFEQGIYRQDRSFVRQVATTIRDRGLSPFVLLDAQREGFAKCMLAVEQVLRPPKRMARRRTVAKSVIIIDGPPGSGKSAIAARLWAALAGDDGIGGDVVLTTTSASQRSNWEASFKGAIGNAAGAGLVRSANHYNPGLHQGWLKSQRDSGQRAEVEDWRGNIARYRQHHSKLKCEDDSVAVSIVDEAHALIDPTPAGARGIAPSGWQLHAGPQAWHIIRSSRVSIFLMDPRQSYRENETTTIDAIKAYAREFGCAEVEVVSLEGCQFRCAGSTEYTDWVDGLLANSQRAGRASWRASNGGPFAFALHNSIREMEDTLRTELASGKTARLVATYARQWRTQGMVRPHALPPAEMDFHIADHAGGTPTWSRIWNYAPDGDYSIFVQAPQGSRIAADPLCEVGCPYVVRGFDFDHIGLLWLSDMVWRGDRWIAQLDHIHESAWRLGLGRAKKGDAAAREGIVERLRRSYRILLTRAIRGMHLWVEDEETRERVRTMLGDRQSGEPAHS